MRYQPPADFIVRAMFSSCQTKTHMDIISIIRLVNPLARLYIFSLLFVDRKAMEINMKILYRQKSEIDNKTYLSTLNIQNSYLKEIIFKNDYKMTTHKLHYHTEYEIHMIFVGKQCYEVCGNEYEVHENEFIIIPPKTMHRTVFASENLHKYSITFNSTDILNDLCYHGGMSETIVNGIIFIAEEFRKKMPSSPLLIENRVLEVLLLLFRSIGFEKVSSNAELNAVDNRFVIASKFISDNIEQNLSVADVAFYCHLSPRQLTRIFLSTEGISPAKYINNIKMEKIGEYIKTAIYHCNKSVNGFHTTMNTTLMRLSKNISECLLLLTEKCFGEALQKPESE